MQLLVALVLVFSLKASGQDLKLPALTSPVMDLAGLLSDSEERQLVALAYELHTNNGPQITILTVNDLQGYAIEDFSIRLAEKWQLGSREKDNGLLVIISKAERKVRIEVGGGIEGEITDFDTARFTRQIFPEYFKRGDFHQGLLLFMKDVALKFNIKTSGRTLVRKSARSQNTGPLQKLLLALGGVLVMGSLFFRKRPLARGLFTAVGFTGISVFLGAALVFILVAFVFGLILGLVGVGNFLSALAYGRGGGYYGGGGGFGGGGGWSGGGGGFSGGGSSGSW